jgi:membrane protease YdiL (CAAX protease family)
MACGSGIAVIVAVVSLIFCSSTAFAQAVPAPPASHADPAAPAVAAPSEGAAAGLVAAEVLLGLGAAVVLFVLWRRDVIRPGSFARRGARDVSPWPAWFYLVCGVAAFMSQGVGASLGAPIGGAIAAATSSDHELGQKAGAVAGGTLAGIAAALALLILIAGRTPNAADRGLSPRVRLRGLLAGLIGIAAAYPVVYAAGLLSGLIFALLGGGAPHALNHETLREVHEHPHSAAVWVMAGVAVLGAPIAEELLFRVYLQSALLRLIGRTWPAIFLTSAFFAVVHIGGGVKASEAYVLGPLFVLSVAMGIAYERTRTPVTSIVMHMAFNGVNVLLAVL